MKHRILFRISKYKCGNKNCIGVTLHRPFDSSDYYIEVEDIWDKEESIIEKSISPLISKLTIDIILDDILKDEDIQYCSNDIPSFAKINNVDDYIGHEDGSVLINK